MSVVVKSKKGKRVVLLNPSEKADKFAKELKQNIKRTNEGKFKLNSKKKGIRLNKEERAYRSGYLAAYVDGVKCHYAAKKKHGRK